MIKLNVSKQLLGEVDDGSIKTAGLILGKLLAADAAAHRILTACDNGPSLYPGLYDVRPTNQDGRASIHRSGWKPSRRDF